jgi:hypothetical protein
MSLLEHQSNRNSGARMERAVSRAVMVLGLALAVGLGYFGRGAGESLSLFLPGLAGLAVVGGVNWFGRVRTRGRWEAAWEAYVAEREGDSHEPVERGADAELCLAGGR